LRAGQADDTRIGSHPAGLATASASAAEKSWEKSEKDDEGDEKADGARSGTGCAADGSGTGSAAGLAISSATRLSAAKITEGSGTSPASAVELIRAPAFAASDWPVWRVSDTGSDGELVSDRHRSSHS
jgi:hypothetical protein